MSRVLDEVSEQFRFHERQLHDFLASLQAQVLKVNDFVPKSKYVQGVRAAGGGFVQGPAFTVLPVFAPQQASHASDEDGEVERFGQIVVGPGFKSLQNVFGARAGG